jgi:hypothetical protein
MMGAHWRVVTRHLYRRTALARKRQIEQLQLAAADSRGVEERAELSLLGVHASSELRVPPKRWHGFSRVEALQ